MFFDVVSAFVRRGARRPAPAPGLTDRDQVRALQLYEHYRTADRAEFRAEDFAFGTASEVTVVSQDTAGDSGAVPLHPLRRVAAGEAPPGTTAPPDLFSQSGRHAWRDRARYAAGASSQNFLWLGWTEGCPTFLESRGGPGHCLLAGSSGDGKTSLGALPLLLQFLEHRAIRPEYLDGFMRSLAQRLRAPVDDAFHRLAENRLRVNLLFLLATHERFRPERYDPQTDAYDLAQTVVWANQAVIAECVQHLVVAWEQGNPPACPAVEAVRSAVEAKLAAHLSAHVAPEHRDSLLGRLVVDSHADLALVASARRDLRAPLTAGIAETVTRAIAETNDEATIRARVRNAVRSALSDGAAEGDASALGPGLQNLLEEAVCREALHLLSREAPLTMLGPKYSVVVVDLKGDAGLFGVLRRKAEEAGRTFRFFTTEPGKLTHTYNPFDSIATDGYASSAAQTLLHALGLLHSGEKGFFSAEEVRWTARTLRDSAARGEPVRSFSHLGRLAHEAVESGREEHIRHLRAKLEAIGELPQLNAAPADISIQRAIRTAEVLYFWLPAAEAPQTAEMTAKLVLEEIRRFGDPAHPVILFLDEFQRVIADSENLAVALEQSRAANIHLILSAQSFEALRNASPPVLDTVWENTRLRLVLSGRSPATMKYLGEVSGTRFEEVDETTHGQGGSSSTSYQNSTGTSSGPQGITDSSGSSTGHSSSSNWSVSVHTKRDRVHFADTNFMLDLNSEPQTSLVFVSHRDQVIAPPSVDPSRPFVLRHEHVISRAEFEAISAEAWPSPAAYPDAHVFTRRRPVAERPPEGQADRDEGAPQARRGDADGHAPKDEVRGAQDPAAEKMPDTGAVPRPRPARPGAKATKPPATTTDAGPPSGSPSGGDSPEEVQRKMRQMRDRLKKG